VFVHARANACVYVCARECLSTTGKNPQNTGRGSEPAGWVKRGGQGQEWRHLGTHDVRSSNLALPMFAVQHMMLSALRLATSKNAESRSTAAAASAVAGVADVVAAAEAVDGDADADDEDADDSDEAALGDAGAVGGGEVG
jgi:hypothetical protein